MADDSISDIFVPDSEEHNGWVTVSFPDSEEKDVVAADVEPLSGDLQLTGGPDSEEEGGEDDDNFFSQILKSKALGWGQGGGCYDRRFGALVRWHGVIGGQGYKVQEGDDLEVVSGEEDAAELDVNATGSIPELMCGQEEDIKEANEPSDRWQSEGCKADSSRI
ncbi:hypothetical protein E2562_023979 [Oryza meyeriana var. granulata]|uniref:Uncharacterized protein n=1 Tax=Oryza meyeriana var. granulata TaxID=110450 RepID=A0A6G1BZB0_9ORYZ|nr:hypothetical protein E2562_023979 [Oryza meyeriana var. granulata]